MELEHHRLDPYPMPKDKEPVFVNERWLADKYAYDLLEQKFEVENEKDNIRVYVPLDLNKKEILRRLGRIIAHYEEANEDNEFDFEFDVQTLIWQIEIYDQIWFVRHMPTEHKHSDEARGLVREFVAKLEEIPDGCAECFPFALIDDLKAEFLDD